jgi:hypothetical protein
MGGVKVPCATSRGDVRTCRTHMNGPAKELAVHAHGLELENLPHGYLRSPRTPYLPCSGRRLDRTIRVSATGDVIRHRRKHHG